MVVELLRLILLLAIWLLGVRAVLMMMMLGSAAVALVVGVGGLVVASAMVVIRRGYQLAVIEVGRFKGCRMRLRMEMGRRKRGLRLG